MAIFIGHKTALAYWRSHNRNWAQPISQAAPRESNAPFYSQIDTGALWKLGIDEKPISLLVSKEANRRRSQNLSPHIWSEKHPSRSFYKVEEGLYMSTPEATFFQLGNSLSLVQLITIGYELCGSYGLNDQADKGFVRKDPRSNPRFIKRYLDKCSRLHGIKTAKRASNYVVEGSASPMESLLSMLLCLPPLLGGFGLPRPELNYPIKTDEKPFRCAGAIYAGRTSDLHSNTTAIPFTRAKASFTLIQAGDQSWRKRESTLFPSQKIRFSTGSSFSALRK